MADYVTYNHFINRYLSQIPFDFKWQTTPLQIYPLEEISNYLKVPTALLQADYYFIVYVREGTFFQQIGIEDIGVKGDSILFVPEGEVFSIRSIQSELSGYLILMESKVVSSITNKIELSELLSIDRLHKLNIEDSNWINTLCALISHEINVKPNRKTADGLLQALFHKLISLNGGEKFVSRQNQIAQNFMRVLNKKYRKEKTVEFYAQELNVSKNYLNRCVKSRYNKNCKQIIQETAIVQSQILMLDTSRDISEIAFLMGYDDLSYFSRLFKKVTGQTPSKFKDKIKHGLS